MEERNKEIVEKYLSKKYSYRQLGKEYNISYERVRAIVLYNIGSKELEKLKIEKALINLEKRKPKILCKKQ